MLTPGRGMPGQCPWPLWALSFLPAALAEAVAVAVAIAISVVPDVTVAVFLAMTEKVSPF